MAKKPNVNVAEEIRKYSEKNPEDGPKAVADGLKKLGIQTTAAYVSTIKNLDKTKAAGGRAAAKGGRGVRGGELSWDALAQAKDFAGKVGGIDKAKRTLDALARLVS